MSMITQVLCSNLEQWDWMVWLKALPQGSYLAINMCVEEREISCFKRAVS